MGVGRRGSHLSHRVRSPADTVLLPRPEEKEDAGGVGSFRNFLPLCVGRGGCVGGCISRISFVEFAGGNRADSGIEDADEVDVVSSSCPGFAPVLSLLGRTSLPPMWWIMEDPSAPTTTMLFLVEAVKE